MAKSELENLVSQIRKNAKQIAVNKVDEVSVMRSMLNDPEFTLGVYDKSTGYIGQRSPHKEAISFVKDIVAGATGLDSKESELLANNYEWTKKNANFLVTNMKDFLNVYTSTGRKITVVQNADTEGSIYTKEAPSITKSIPDKDNPGKSKQVTTIPYVKLVSQTHCPKYKTE